MTRYDISFVLPMYNEAANINQTLRKISNLAKDVSGDYEIVVVDDASEDGCGDMADRIALEDSRIKSIRLKANTKFGGALWEGIKNASEDIILYTDSDLPVSDEDIKRGLGLLDDADIVTGYSLVIKDTSFKRIVMSKIYNFLVELLFGLDIKDINSGFKIYKKKIFEGLELRSRSPFIDVEIFAEAMRRGFKVAQFGLVFDLRTHGRSTISRPGIVMRTFWDMFVYRFSGRR